MPSGLPTKTGLNQLPTTFTDHKPLCFQSSKQTVGSCGHDSWESIWKRFQKELGNRVLGFLPHWPNTARQGADLPYGILIFALHPLSEECENRIFNLPQLSQRLGAIKTGTQYRIDLFLFRPICQNEFKRMKLNASAKASKQHGPPILSIKCYYISHLKSKAF